MAREIVTGNGRLVVAVDSKLRVRDFFYPMVGSENHLAGHFMRMGVWVDGRFSWVGDGWKIENRYLPETPVSRCRALNSDLEIELEVNDAVYSSADYFLRKIAVRNLSLSSREVRVFFSHDFHLYGLDTGDTALYNPDWQAVLHYKGRRHFLISGITDQGEGLFQLATGYKEAFGLEGSWKDAEDGILSGNPVAQGSVDSVVSFQFKMSSKSESCLYYWIVCGTSMEAVEEMHHQVKKIGVEQLLLVTENYWSAWVNKRTVDLSLLPRDIVRLFKTSLILMRMHVDNGGAMIASPDSDVLQFNRDTYAYVWPRDAAIAAVAFDAGGFEEVSRLFFEFSNRVISKRGYFYHKYAADGSQGSSWHALVNITGQPQLPIQEDETALVLSALWNHFQRYRDMEFISKVYPNLVVKTTEFLLSHIDGETGLPRPSFDLWEEKYGVFTATVATVAAALEAAAGFARVFFDRPRQKMLSQTAARMKSAMIEHLYDRASGHFLKAIYPDGSRDPTADSSLCFLFTNGPFSAVDPLVISTMNYLVDRLWIKSEIGGMARYENDEYYRVSPKMVGNPWFPCTLWLARWQIARATILGELKSGLDLLVWTVRHASDSGVLGEQMNPFSGQPVSVSPLLWSHAEFVLAVYQYLEKYRLLSGGKIN